MPLNNIPVSVLLIDKGSVVYSIPVHSTVETAVSEMNRQNIGSILIMDNGKVVGIFTERDVLVRVVSKALDPRETPVKDVMTSDLRRINAETSIEDTMQIMTEYRTRHLPVFDDEKLLGLVSIGDVTRWLLKINETEAENLRKYVYGDYPG